MFSRLGSWRLYLMIAVVVSLAIGSYVPAFAAVTEITVVSPSRAPQDELTRKLLPEFYKKHPDIRVEWINIPSVEIHQKLAVEFAAKSDAYDVVAILSRYMGSFAGPGHLQPLDDLMKGDPQFNPASVLDVIARWKGKTVGWPWRPAAGLVHVYNKRMLKDAGLDKPPANWEELLEYHKKLYRPPNSYGIALDLDESLIPYHQFQPVLYYKGGEEFDDPLEPEQVRFNSDIGVKTIEFLKQFTPYYPAGWETMAQMDSVGMLLQGRLAMRQQFEWIYNFATDPSKSQVVKDIGLAPYMGPSPKMAWNFTIPVYSKKKAAAWKFIKWVTSAEVEKKVALMGTDASPVRLEVRSDPEVIKVEPWLAVIAKGTFYPESQFDGVAPYYLEMGRQVKLALAGRITPKQALDAIEKEVKKYLKKK